MQLTEALLKHKRLTHNFQYVIPHFWLKIFKYNFKGQKICVEHIFLKGASVIWVICLKIALPFYLYLGSMSFDDRDHVHKLPSLHRCNPARLYLINRYHNSQLSRQTLGKIWHSSDKDLSYWCQEESRLLLEPHFENEWNLSYQVMRECVEKKVC